jgi:hypothetical protein
VRLVQPTIAVLGIRKHPSHKEVPEFRRAQAAGNIAALLLQGSVPLSPTGAELLFEIFSQHHERG